MKNLIIVDVQKGFINENNSDIVGKVNELIESKTFDKIYATKFVNKADSQYVKYLDWSAMTNKEETDFAFDCNDEIEVVEKTSYGLPLDLLNRGVTNCNEDEFYICGTDLDACVLAIMYQLFDLGFKVFMISDATGSSSKKVDKEFVKLIIKRNFGKDSII